MSRDGDSTAAPTRDAVARIFARLTADRDELRAELEVCQRRLAHLERVVEERGAAPAAEQSARVGDETGATALRLAEEALATAQFALEQARRRD
jgi:hypothetical protein